MRATSLRFVRVLTLAIAPLAAATAASAQQAGITLNENCTISVLNRNVRVRPDGSWVLPNVPANFGLVRARVTCIVNGQTISGESEPFVIPPNGVINHPKITFGQTTAIPRSLAVTPSAPLLTQAGATAQLTVIAGFADNTTRDVTSGAGTQYTISNAAIATVSDGGVVQAIKSGTVIVQATNEEIGRAHV